MDYWKKQPLILKDMLISYRLKELNVKLSSMKGILLLFLPKFKEILKIELSSFMDILISNLICSDGIRIKEPQKLLYKMEDFMEEEELMMVIVPIVLCWLLKLVNNKEFLSQVNLFLFKDALCSLKETKKAVDILIIILKL